ncbi:hypothetical protein [Streptomyces sp. NPDC006012]|uniref:hypothetical protein n=1 Tax=Streptomyces sp. NPDC006012 TaxID=3364739 RepID=UPI0036761A4A
MPIAPDAAITALLENRTHGQLPKIGELTTLAYRNWKGEDKEARFTWSTWILRQTLQGRIGDYSDKMVAALKKHGYKPKYNGDVYYLEYDASLIQRGQSGNSQGLGESSVTSVGQSGSADAGLYPGSGYPAGISPQDHAVLSSEHGQSGDSQEFNWVDSVPNSNLLEDHNLLADLESPWDLGIPVDQDGSLAQAPVFLNQVGAGSQGFSDGAYGNFGQFQTDGYASNIWDITGINNPLAPHAWGTQPQSGTGMPYNPNIGDITGINSPLAGHSRGTQSQFGGTGQQRQSSSQGDRTDQQLQAPKGKRKATRR